MAFSPDGKHIAASVASTVKVWDAFTGQEKLALDHGAMVLKVAFSADGRQVVSASGNRWSFTLPNVKPSDSSVKVWDAVTGQEKFAFRGHTGDVKCVAFSADGKHIACGGANRTVEVREVATGRKALTLTGLTREVIDVAFSAGRQHILTGDYSGSVRVWDGATGQEKQHFATKPYPDGVTTMAISADGQRAVCGTGEGTMTLWDTTTGQAKLYVAEQGLCRGRQPGWPAYRHDR